MRISLIVTAALALSPRLAHASEQKLRLLEEPALAFASVPLASAVMTHPGMELTLEAPAPEKAPSMASVVAYIGGGTLTIALGVTAEFASYYVGIIGAMIGGGTMVLAGVVVAVVGSAFIGGGVTMIVIAHKLRIERSRINDSAGITQQAPAPVPTSALAVAWDL